MRPYLNWIEGRPTKPLVARSNRAGRTRDTTGYVVSFLYLLATLFAPLIAGVDMSGRGSYAEAPFQF